jgi:hypothetical protein
MYLAVWYSLKPRERESPIFGGWILNDVAVTVSELVWVEESSSNFAIEGLFRTVLTHFDCYANWWLFRLEGCSGLWRERARNNQMRKRNTNVSSTVEELIVSGAPYLFGGRSRISSKSTSRQFLTRLIISAISCCDSWRSECRRTSQ